MCRNGDGERKDNNEPAASAPNAPKPGEYVCKDRDGDGRVALDITAKELRNPHRQKEQ